MERMERSFAELEYGNKKKKTWREKFPGRTEALIPCSTLLEDIKPYYPCGDKGRVSCPLESIYACIAYNPSTT